jgi:hypothetical protein
VPKNTNLQAARGMKFLSKPYEAVAEIFRTGTQDRLRAEIEAGMQIWQEVSPLSALLRIYPN